MDAEYQLMAKPLYGWGLRLIECLRLRVNDVGFGQRQIIVRGGKGDKHHLTMLPEALVEQLTAHLARVKALLAHPQAHQLPHLPAQLRHASAGDGLRHPHDAGTAGHSDVSTTMIYTHVPNNWLSCRICPTLVRRIDRARKRETRASVIALD
jgi:site-specific recombinase XerD